MAAKKNSAAVQADVDVMSSRSTEPLHIEEQRPNTKHRGHWSNQLDFTFSCLGYSVGLGNVWRFPYLCYKNGGGAFLIPYLIFLFLAGLPLFYMELAVGQFASLGPIKIFQRMAPIFSGLGVSMVVISGLICIYYNMIIAWTFFYLFASMQSELPWEKCGQEWNTENCLSLTAAGSCKQADGIYANHTCYYNKTEAKLLGLENIEKNNTVPPSQEYFSFRVLKKSNGALVTDESRGIVQWELVGCLALAWLLVCLCLVKGIKSSGKVVYITVLLPYVLLIVLLCRAATLDGALEGVKFYILPNFNLLKDFKVWYDAASQVLFSLGIAHGGLTTLASYNKFKNNCFRDAFIIVIGDSVSSIFAGFVIFSIIGFMAHEAGMPVNEVVETGPGLAFVAYPEAVARLSGSVFWAIIFFVMVITLGLDSQFAVMTTVLTACTDQWPKIMRWKEMFVCGVCFVWFILGLPLCTQVGYYMLELINCFTTGWNLIVVGLFEVLIICYCYGTNRFSKDIIHMMGVHRFDIYWKVTWMLCTPGILCAILLWSWISTSPVKVDGYVYPLWADALGWVIACASVIFIPLGAIIVVKNIGINTRLLRATEEWGPADMAHMANGATPPEINLSNHINTGSCTHFFQ